MRSYKFFLESQLTLDVDFVSQPITHCFSWQLSKQGSWVLAGQGTILLTVAVSYACAAAQSQFPLRVHRRAVTGRQNGTAMGGKGLKPGN